jgi:hypothetical protein
MVPAVRLFPLMKIINFTLWGTPLSPNPDPL